MHGNSDGMVVGVDRFWVVRAAGWAEWLSGGEKGFDGFVSENEQRSSPSDRLVAVHSGGSVGCGEGSVCRGVSSDRKRRGEGRTVMGFVC